MVFPLYNQFGWLWYQWTVVVLCPRLQSSLIRALGLNLSLSLSGTRKAPELSLLIVQNCRILPMSARFAGPQPMQNCLSQY